MNARIARADQFRKAHVPAANVNASNRCGIGKCPADLVCDAIRENGDSMAMRRYLMRMDQSPFEEGAGAIIGERRTHVYGKRGAVAGFVFKNKMESMKPLNMPCMATAIKVSEGMSCRIVTS